MNTMQVILDAGLVLNTDNDRLFVGPASRLTDDLRDLIRAHKVELLAAVREAERVTADLIASINRCCDARGDTERNRAGLLSEIGDFDQRLQADLVEHFDGEADRFASIPCPVPAAAPAQHPLNDQT